jgi:hypothetical protein
MDSESEPPLDLQRIHAKAGDTPTGTSFAHVISNLDHGEGGDFNVSDWR